MHNRTGISHKGEIVSWRESLFYEIARIRDVRYRSEIPLLNLARRITSRVVQFRAMLMRPVFFAFLFAAVIFPQGGSSQDPPKEFDGQPVYRVGSGVTPPKARHMPSPNYSKEGRKKRIEGIAVLKAIIAPDGRAHDITVARSLGYGLDEQAVKAIQQWRFEPALRDGKPVPVSVAIEVNFHLY